MDRSLSTPRLAVEFNRRATAEENFFPHRARQSAVLAAFDADMTPT